MEKIGLQAVLEDEQFQAALKRYMQGEQEMRHATDSSTQQQSGAWTFLATAAGAAVGTIVGQLLNNLIPTLQKAATAGIDSLTRWGEGLDKLSDQFGFSGQESAKWSIAMRKVGVAPEEASFQLNYFTRQLDDAKKAMAESPHEFISKKTPEEIANLNEKLADAQVRLQRAQKAFSEAKNPTDQMRYAIDDAKKSIERINADLKDASILVPKKMKDAAGTVTPFQKSLDKLGISAFDAKGKVKSFNVIMPEIMDAFKKLPQGIESSAIAMDLFGARGGTKFLDFLRQGKLGLEEAGKLAKEFGLDLSSEQVDAIEKYGFAWNEVNTKIQGLLTQLGTALFPAFQELVKQINDQILPAVNQWIKDNKDKLLKGIQDLGDWVGGVLIPALQNFYNWITTNIPIIQKIITDAFNNEIKPKLDAFKTWMDTDGKQALQTFYDKLVEMKPFVDDWLALLKDLHESLKGFQTVLQDTNSELDETGNHFNILNSTVSGAMDNLRLIIDTAFGGIRTAQQTWQAATRGDWDGFLAGIIGIFQSAWSISIPGILTRASQWLGEQMANLVIGMANAIWNSSDAIFDALVAPFRNAIDWIRSNWGWSSPPKIFIELGQDVSKALEIGLGGMDMGKMITQQVMPMTQAAATYNNYNRSSTFINNAPIYSSDYIGSRIDQQLNRWNKGQ